MSQDTLSNMLSAIKNASMVNKESVEIPYSKTSEAVAKVLEKTGFITKVKVFKEKNSSHKGLNIELAYEDNGDPKIHQATRVSSPGRRIYRGTKEIRYVKPQFGLLVVSTSKGIMSGEEARTKKLGGEVICEVK